MNAGAPWYLRSNQFWKISFLLLLSFFLASGTRANIVLVEDFEDDINPGAAGFDTMFFDHNIVGQNWALVAPAIPLPSPPHALFLGADTTDWVTFTLGPGLWVQSAEVWMTGTGGGEAGVTFLGSIGSISFSTNAQDNLQLFSVGPADNLGEIIGVILGDLPPLVGQEAFYDNLAITVVPEPSALALLGSILIGGCFSRRFRIHC